MANVTKEDVIEFISSMTVLELSELIKELEEKFGVSAAAPVAMMAAGPAGEGGRGSPHPCRANRAPARRRSQSAQRGRGARRRARLAGESGARDAARQWLGK